MKKYAIMCLNNFLCINIQEGYPYPFLATDGSAFYFDSKEEAENTIEYLSKNKIYADNILEKLQIIETKNEDGAWKSC